MKGRSGYVLMKAGKFLKNEIVLCVAVILAVISMFFVPPSAAYLSYIDVRVLALLFCLMMIVSGLRSVGVFEKLMQILAGIVRNTRQLVLVLVMICFIFSMWITNDVALITFVPFAIMVLNEAGQKRLLPYVIVLQTVAANLGSMCTPIGNPQNLYLYTVSGISMWEFFRVLLPYTLFSFVLVTAGCLFVKPEALDVLAAKHFVPEKDSEQPLPKAEITKQRLKTGLYIGLFMLSLLTVLHVLHYLVLFAVVVVVILIVQPKLFREADYFLLIMFAAFFIFVGNIKQIEQLHVILSSCVAGNEVAVSVFASQLISNVPAAVLLSGFTSDFKGLLIGTNIGGLGTLIASMASLISYKFYAKEPECDKKKYLFIFTVFNVVCLALLLVLAWILS